MLFNSIEFLVFLPVVFAAYWLLGRRSQNAFLVAASYFFYGWWDWRFLGLIVLSSVVDYVAALGIGKGTRPRLWLALSLVVNLGVLGVFKYLDFGIESLAAVLEAVGLRPHLSTLGVVVPVGISFYTFQTLSYSIDVYRRQIEPTRDFLAFLAFVSFFPQLVAGPIERATSFMPQFLRERRFEAELALDGVKQMLYGLLLKVVVADNLAAVVDPVYEAPQSQGSWSLAVATVAFAFQIYGDFAGYSHIAIGCARLFGFSLRRNFAYPYFARSPAEFWHRWHISLSTWFRDYVYIPLGGSRWGWARKSVNVFVTFVISGLWHGAGFTFVVWGALHGLAVALQWWSPRTKLEAPMGFALLPRARDVAAMLLTFGFVCAGWVFFRAHTVGEAVLVLRGIGELPFADVPDRLPKELYAIPALLAVEWLARGREHGLAFERLPRLAEVGLCGAVLLALAAFGRVETVPFVYFQF